MISPERTLPGWFENYRPYQEDTIDEIVEHFKAGIKVVLLSAPTGSGKTLLGESVRQRLDTHALYVCSSLVLMDQMLRDYPYAKNLRGRSNFPTLNNPELFDDPDVRLSTADCDKDEGLCSHCYLVSKCPYEVAKREALSSKLICTNMAYWLLEARHVGRLKDVPLVIIDEFDELESKLLSLVSVEVGPRLRKELRLPAPERKTVGDTWPGWFESSIPRVKKALSQVDEQISERGDELFLARQRRRYAELLDRLEYAQKQLSADQWVFTGYRQEKDRIEFRPIRPRAYARPFVWNQAKRFLGMSATLIAPHIEAKNLNLTNDEFRVVTMPSTFDPARRPIRLCPVADMSRNTRDTSWPKMAAGIGIIVNRFHVDDRVLIHAHTYELSQYLCEQLSVRSPSRLVLTYRNAREREAALERYRRTTAAVLIACSLERGVDLPGDDCRAVIWAKGPWGYLGDAVVKARRYSAEDGESWYVSETIKAVVQGSGRAMRSSADSAVTWIVDRRLTDLIRHHKWGEWFPAWYRDAIEWGGPWRKMVDRALDEVNAK